MNMNFGSDLANKDVKATAGESNFLKGDAIYDVKLKDVREEVIKGKEKDGAPGQEYHVLVMEFAEINPETGTIDENSKVYANKTFPITEQSAKRNTFKRVVDGKETEIELPSIYETTMAKFKQYMSQLCPEYYNSLLTGKNSLSGINSWDAFKKVMITLFSKVTKSDKNPSCKLKLVKNKQGFATIPNFVALNREGQYYVNNNFLGNIDLLTKEKREIAFSDYEMSQIEKRKKAAKEATSTTQLMGMSAPAASNTAPITGGSESVDQVNFDDIDLSSL